LPESPCQRLASEPQYILWHAGAEACIVFVIAGVWGIVVARPLFFLYDVTVQNVRR